MFFPPTILPFDFRKFVDPPPAYQPAPESPPELVASPRWSRLRSIICWARSLRRPANRPCEALAES
jgi:hypothetical protein